MFLLIIACILILITLSAIKKYYNNLLKQEIVRKYTDNVNKCEKIYTFIINKFFFLIVFFNMFQILFSFLIQMSTQMEN
jgi:hypothetical protein